MPQELELCMVHSLHIASSVAIAHVIHPREEASGATFSYPILLSFGFQIKVVWADVSAWMEQAHDEHDG